MEYGHVHVYSIPVRREVNQSQSLREALGGLWTWLGLALRGGDASRTPYSVDLISVDGKGGMNGDCVDTGDLSKTLDPLNQFWDG
jgi:hypothetical protein